MRGIGRGRRGFGGTICAIALAVVAATPAHAAKGPGDLDRSFSRDGKAVTVFPPDAGSREYVNYALPFEFAPGRIAMAAAKGGRLVAASSQAIVGYLANGRRNPGFGGNGAVPIDTVEGSRFQVADVAVDSQNRILIAGTTRPTPAIGMPDLPVPGPVASTATIRRYLPNGQLDTGFGAGGVVNTDLGAPRPSLAGSSYPASAVGVVGLAVDPADRPVITGSAVVEVGNCMPSKERYEASQAIVARLTVDGGLDTSFAGSGLTSLGVVSWLGSPAATSAGILAAGVRGDPCSQGGADNPSVLASLAGEGGLNPRFAAGGLFSRPFTRISDLAVAPSGKILLLARTIELSRGRWIESAGRAIRLRRNGSIDIGFGRRGRAELPLPKRGSVAAIAVDGKDRVLLAGDVSPRPRGRGPRSKFLLMRLSADGEPDRRFGRRGRAVTSFGRRSRVRATDVLAVRGGKVVVGGKLSGPSIGNGFALARYLGR